MKKVLKNSLKTKKFLDKLPKIYIVAFWSRFGVKEFPFSGKFIKDELRGNLYIPLVYDRDETCDLWRLKKITNTAAGAIVLWTQNRNVAEKVAAMYNQHMV